MPSLKKITPEDFTVSIHHKEGTQPSNKGLARYNLQGPANLRDSDEQ